MKQIGWGILQDGKGVGICPTSRTHALEMAQRYKERAPSKRVEIAEIYSGEPVPFVHGPLKMSSWPE